MDFCQRAFVQLAVAPDQVHAHVPTALFTKLALNCHWHTFHSHAQPATWQTQGFTIVEQQLVLCITYFDDHLP